MKKIKTNIKIQKKYGIAELSDFEINAYDLENGLIVHRPVEYAGYNKGVVVKNYGWVISHKESGYAISQTIKLKDDAIMFAGKFEEILDWTMDYQKILDVVYASKTYEEHNKIKDLRVWIEESYGVN